jgi:hypothetical protein
MYLSALFAAVAAIAMTGAACAESFKPVQAQKVDLGAFAGVAYYTVEQGGHRLVVTLQAHETGTPVRFAATLAPGQDVTLSVPRKAGESPVELHFVRHGEQIVMNGATAAMHAATQTD